MNLLDTNKPIIEEKMMLHDVVEEISTINVNDMDPFAKSRVIVELHNGVILRAQLKFQEEINEEIDFLLDKKLEEKVFELKYKGRTKIKKDVLKRMKAIADLLQSCQTYPVFSRKYVEVCIKQILEQPDPRVFKEYITSIDNCLENKLSYYHDVDISSFVKSLDEKFKGGNNV